MLGQGGFAWVYEGIDLTLEKMVAIKILRPSLKDQEQSSKARFFREARIGAMLTHPDIARVYDFGTDGDHAYLIMERLEGHSLAREIWNNGPLSAARAYHLTLHVLHALAHVHEKGTIHRDIKPSNLFLVYPGEFVERLKIVDFGIAFSHHESSSRLTKTQEVLGTSLYLAPEYIDERLVTPAIDVYQVALTFVEMLTGVPLHGEERTDELVLPRVLG